MIIILKLGNLGYLHTQITNFSYYTGLKTHNYNCISAQN